MTARKKKISALDSALESQRTGDLEGAETGLRAVLEGSPDHPDALLLLGDLLRRTGRAADGVGLIARAIETAPGQGRTADPSWRVALAFAKRDAGDVEGALAEIDALLNLAPNTADLIFIRAELLQRLERHDEAIAAYEAHLERKPGNARALNNMAVSLEKAGRLVDAFQAYDRAATVSPKYTQALGNLGRVLLDIGQPEAAIRQLRRAHALDPSNRMAEFALIDALLVGDHPEEAEQLAEAAHRAHPDDPSALVHLGNARMTMGRRQEAAELARRGREIDPRAPGVLSLAAEADSEADTAELLREIESVLDGMGSSKEAINLHFVAARLCEQMKRYPEAFDHYIAGNAARHETLDRFGKGYDRKAAESMFDDIIAAFPAERMTGPGGSGSELPIFIVGMPRSGTSLTEQILASHPQVAGAGELVEIPQIVRWMRKLHGYPGKLPGDIIAKASKGYLERVGKIGRGAARVTDKMPGNFMDLGLIARMFPKARLIHCRRDAMDNGLSCFAQNFRVDELAWTTDLAEIGHQYCLSRRLMAHWRAVLPPGRMLEIDYEDTVADLEGQARRLIEFAGLEWDDACLDFHKTERAVVSASRVQVRNPIYNSSVGRWKRYGDGVLPLARVLAACGCGPEVTQPAQ